RDIDVEAAVDREACWRREPGVGDHVRGDEVGADLCARLGAGIGDVEVVQRVDGQALRRREAGGECLEVPAGEICVMRPVVASATYTLPMESIARAEGLVKLPRVEKDAAAPPPTQLAPVENLRTDLLAPSAT